MSLVIFLVVGLLAGWIASAVMGEGGFGLFGYIIIGVIGAFIGGYVFKWLDISLPGGFIRDKSSSTFRKSIDFWCNHAFIYNPKTMDSTSYLSWEDLSIKSKV